MTLLAEMEDSRLRARHALDTATCDTLVGLCRQYLALLAEYRAELHGLPATLGLQRHSDVPGREDSRGLRKALRAAIENVTRERNQTEALLLSFVSVSGYEAVETLNRLKYRGHDDWELRAGGVARFSREIAGERMSVLEAVDAAGLLRREEYVSQREAPALPLRQCSTDSAPPAGGQLTKGVGVESL